MTAQLVLTNARIATSGDLVAIVLDGRDIREVVPSAQAPSGVSTIDLQGRTVLPGVDDAHLHAYEHGRALTAIDLAKVTSLGELREALACAAPEAPGWYRGHGWDGMVVHGSAHDGGLIASDIDDVTPGGPALLGDSTGHVALCNNLALRAAGIHRSTPDPQGGIIVRNADGDPTGLLLEAAVALVSQAIPEISRADRIAALRAAHADLLARGIVAVTDPGLGPGGRTLMDGTGTLDAVEAYEDLDRSGGLLLRTHVMLLFGGLGGTTADAVACGLDDWGPPRRSGRGGRLSIDQVKVFADGIPRSRTAWLSEPYDDCTHGHMTVAGNSDEERVAELHAIVSAAARRGWQVGAHCTGDATITAYIDAVEATGTSHQLGHYLIHGDLIRKQDLPRLASLGMTLNTNPGIRWSVGHGVSSILGEARNLGRQPLQSARSAGVNVVASSDAPVTLPDWGTILAAAMTRALRDDPAYTDDESVTGLEAVEMMTVNAARQSSENGWRGRLAPGMAADLVVLDSEVDWADPWSLKDSSVCATLIDGSVVFGSLT